jgi:uncharacterized protein YjbI with pentapeptide repeats
MEEVDFTEADIKGSVFDNCKLNMAVFDGTNLEKADLSTAADFSIDPERNKVKQAKFSLYGLAGLLHKYHIEVE